MARQTTDRKFAGKHFVETTEGIDVGAMINGIGMLDLFRGHVRGVPTLVPACVSVRSGAFATEQFARPKSQSSRDLFIDEDVLRFDVPVHDSFIVRKLERLADTWDNRQRFLRRNLIGPHQFAQVSSVHEFHDEIEKSFHLAKVVHRDDVGMT
jgi:hypothetical protein